MADIELGIKIPDNITSITEADEATFSDIIYFELNNWMSGRDFPASEPFITWCSNDYNLYFSNEKWVKENKLCVVQSLVDMSVNWCISAPREWVEKNCPDLLSDKEYDVTFIRHSNGKDVEIIEHHSFSQFLRYPTENTDYVYGRFGNEFLEYKEENIGIQYDRDSYDDEDEDDEDDE